MEVQALAERIVTLSILGFGDGGDDNSISQIFTTIKSAYPSGMTETEVDCLFDAIDNNLHSRTSNPFIAQFTRLNDAIVEYIAGCPALYAEGH